MKYSLSYEGNTLEDDEEMRIIFHAPDIFDALIESQNFIHNRLKYANDISEQEIKTLTKLQEILWVEGVK